MVIVKNGKLEELVALNVIKMVYEICKTFLVATSVFIVK
jgi:hypothetical protein